MHRMLCLRYAGRAGSHLGRDAVSCARTFSISPYIRATTVLALESSADDTCVAIVDSDRKIHSNVVIRQSDLLAQWGGINPYHATARHQNTMATALRQCLNEAKLDVSAIDAIAYTRGPGMPSCLATCSLAAKTLASAYQKPLIGVHHMQAHALTVGLTEQTQPAFPYLTLLISGGHTLLLHARGAFDFDILATTNDNSIGDAYDKVARMLEVPWGSANSGGQALESFINEKPSSSVPRFAISMPNQLEFSYAGLKSAVKRHMQRSTTLDEDDKRAIASAFQEAAVGQLEEKVSLALAKLKGQELSSLVVSGGVASNQYLRQRLASCLAANGRISMRLLFPPVSLCTDNAAMIAWAALERYRRGMFDAYDAPIRAKWSIEDCVARD